MDPKSCPEVRSSLKNKVIMVTGASSGLGLEFCLDLAKAGCRILAAARRVDKLKSLCDEINQFDYNDKHPCCRAVAVELDIASHGPAIDERVAKAWDVFGRIDALINNAGIRGLIRSALEISEEEWKEVVNTNLIGTWQVSKCVAARMHAGGHRGSIINISSIAGLNRVQFHGGIAYNSSKSGVDSITRVMALELGQYNIRVNGIAPGLFQSEITKALFGQNLRGVTKRILPLGFNCSINPALTSLIRYLINESSSYVTGNIFIVDGGTTLPGYPIYSSL